MSKQRTSARPDHKTRLPVAPAKEKTRPPEVRLVRYTMELAIEILEDPRNQTNRAVRQRRVEQYAHDMRAGRWDMNGETVKFTKDGRLLDGQHRLWAIVECAGEVAVDMLTVYGLDEDVMPTIDTGAVRGFSDVAKIDGYGNSTILSPTVKWVWWYEHVRQVAVYRAAVATHGELLECLEENKDLTMRIAELTKYKKVRKLLRPGVLGFVYTYAYRTDPEKAVEFLESLENGIGMEAKSPTHLLRERLMGNQMASAKMPPEDVCAITIKAWNAFLNNRRINVLRWIKTEAFPTFGRKEV